jgi:DNA (cytosine-5)-methyltransferase 1
MRRAFEELGYHTDWNVLNSADFGLPQKRERVFIVASRYGQTGLIPLEPDLPKKSLGDISEKGVLTSAWGAETYVTAFNKVTKLAIKNGQFGINILGPDDVLPTVTCAWGGGATRKKVGILDETPDGVAFLRHPTVREGARAQGFPESWVFPSSRTQAWTLIGNAVSSPVSKAIIEHLKSVEAGEHPRCKTAIPDNAPKYVNMDVASSLQSIDWDF